MIKGSLFCFHFLIMIGLDTFIPVDYLWTLFLPVLVLGIILSMLIVPLESCLKRVNTIILCAFCIAMVIMEDIVVCIGVIRLPSEEIY
jgi:hypothetical protein